MKKIHGYNISLWALMFHMLTQARYVIQADKDLNEESFINPLAVEIDKVMTDLLDDKYQISYPLSYNDRKDIVEYMNKHIDPVVKTRRIRPALLLLSTINELYIEDFKPSYDVLGEGMVKEFVEDFTNRAINNDSIASYYEENCFIIKTIIEPFNTPYRARSLIKKYKAEFKTILDKAYGESLSHGWDHIDGVINKAIYFKNKYNIKVEYDEVILSALLHDIYNNENREEHHELAAKWVEASIHPILTNDKEKQKRIAYAIREHRASYIGDYYSPLSELLATADREKPNLEDIIGRMYKYQLDKKMNLTHKEIIAEIIKHLKEKYSRSGYIQYTNMFMLEYKNDLANMLDIIDKIIAKKLVIKIANISGKLNISIRRK